MKILLLEDVAKVGHKYDVIEVARGYALNFLIPRKLGQSANDALVAEYQEKREQEEALRKTREEALREKLAESSQAPIILEAKANEQGHLFAGIKAEDILAAVADQLGLEIPLEYLELGQPIKEAGEHQVSVRVGEESYQLALEVRGVE